MKIKESLVYDKYTVEIVGFLSLGDINDEHSSVNVKIANECQKLPNTSLLS